jgi:hypothetical protein
MDGADHRLLASDLFESAEKELPEASGRLLLSEESVRLWIPRPGSGCMSFRTPRCCSTDNQRWPAWSRQRFASAKGLS